MKKICSIILSFFSFDGLKNQIGAVRFNLATPSLNITSANSPVYLSQLFRTRSLLVKGKLNTQATASGVFQFTDPFIGPLMHLKQIVGQVGTNQPIVVSGQMLGYLNHIDTSKQPYFEMQNTGISGTTKNQYFITLLSAMMAHSRLSIDALWDSKSNLTIQFLQSAADSDVVSNAGYALNSLTLQILQEWEVMPSIPKAYRPATKWYQTISKSYTASTTLNSLEFSPPTGNRLNKVVGLVGTGAQGKITPIAEAADSPTLTGFGIDLSGYQPVQNSIDGRFFKAYNRFFNLPVDFPLTDALPSLNANLFNVGPNGLFVYFANSTWDESVGLSNAIPISNTGINKLLLDLGSTASPVVEAVVETIAGVPTGLNAPTPAK